MYTTYRTANRNRKIGLVLTSALAAGLLTGCATAPGSARRPVGQPGGSRPGQGQAASADRPCRSRRARRAAQRLRTARCSAQPTSTPAGSLRPRPTFNDAMKLGDNSARTALSLALALDGEGKYQQSRRAARRLAEADRSGRPRPGLCAVGPARAGHQCAGDAPSAAARTPPRCARTWPMPTRWPAAGRKRGVMASQDVPADQVGDRMEQWAQMVQPEAWQLRVAEMVGAPAGRGRSGPADAARPGQQSRRRAARQRGGGRRRSERRAGRQRQAGRRAARAARRAEQGTAAGGQRGSRTSMSRAIPRPGPRSPTTSSRPSPRSPLRAARSHK